MEKKNSSKKVAILSIACVVLVALIAVLYFLVLPKFDLAPKNITIKVTSSTGSSTEYRIRTRAKSLMQAMDELASQNSTFSFVKNDGENGTVIETVNNERALFVEDNAYWAIYVNDEFGKYDVDSQPIVNGYVYEWRYELVY